MAEYREPAPGRFIRFELRPPRCGRSTPTVWIYSRKTGMFEGEIRWKGRRGFSLWPAAGSVFGPVCLADVQRVIVELNAAHAARWEPTERGQ